MTHIIQIAATQDRDGNPRLYALYDDGLLFERVIDASREYTIWYQINEPDSIVEEREEQDKKMQEYAFKGGAMQGIMFAGKLRDLPDGVPFPSMDCLLDEKPAEAPPPFIKLMSGAVLKYNEKDNRYHRTNGCWSVGYKRRGQGMIATGAVDEVCGCSAPEMGLEGTYMFPATEEEWRKDEGFEVEE